MTLNFERLMRACFGLGDDVDFHCIDCRLVSGSYVNTQVSSQVIIEFNKSGSFSLRCKRSKHNSLRRSFCPSDSSFGTIFAQTFLMFNSSLRIHRTLSLCLPKIVCAIQTRVHETYNLHRKPQSIIENFSPRISSV